MAPAGKIKTSFIFTCLAVSSFEKENVHFFLRDFNPGGSKTDSKQAFRSALLTTSFIAECLEKRPIQTSAPTLRAIYGNPKALGVQ